MAEIEPLPAANRVPPGHPATGSGQGKGGAQRKPRDDDRQHDQQRQRRKDDDASRIDEYA
jgi:hypothetical protein